MIMNDSGGNAESGGMGGGTGAEANASNDLSNSNDGSTVDASTVSIDLQTTALDMAVIGGTAIGIAGATAKGGVIGGIAATGGAMTQLGGQLGISLGHVAADAAALSARGAALAGPDASQQAMTHAFATSTVDLGTFTGGNAFAGSDGAGQPVSGVSSGAYTFLSDGSVFVDQSWWNSPSGGGNA